MLKLGGFQFTVLKTDILQRTVFKKDMFGFAGGKIHEVSKAFCKVAFFQNTGVKICAKKLAVFKNNAVKGGITEVKVRQITARKNNISKKSMGQARRQKLAVLKLTVMKFKL